MTTLYRDGRVHTMDPGAGEVAAFLVDDGRFVAVGARAEELGRGAAVVDLGGATVVPGMIDAHSHLETDAVSHSRWVDVRNAPLDVMQERLRAAAAAAPAGEWIVGQATFGQDLDMPDRHQLDAAVADRPVLVRASMHALSANTLALRLAGLLDRVAAPVGALIDRDGDGVPTGRLMETYHLFPIPQASIDDTAAMIEEGVRNRFNRHGVTTVFEVPMSKGGVRAFQMLEQSDRLNVRVSLNLAVKPGLQPLIGDIGEWAATGIATGFGNDRLWIGAAKFFLDGARHASFLVRRSPRRPRDWGALTHLYPDLVRALVIAYEAGLQSWFHALGEDAQLLAIDAVTEAQLIVGGDHGVPTRIEHIFNDFPVDDDLLERLRSANIIPVPNPGFVHFDQGTGQFPYRTLLDAGFAPPGNSDNSGTQPFANNPWFGISKMVNRTNKHGVEILPSERISVLEGINAYTVSAARAGLREARIGVIAEGAWADFAVLDADPLTIPPAELETIGSALTVLEGRTVWGG